MPTLDLRKPSALRILTILFLILTCATSLPAKGQDAGKPIEEPLTGSSQRRLGDAQDEVIEINTNLYVMEKARKDKSWSFSPPCEEIPCATYESNFRDAEELDALIYPIQFASWMPQNAVVDLPRLSEKSDTGTSVRPIPRQ